MKPPDPSTDTLHDGRLLHQTDSGTVASGAADESDPVAHAYTDMLTRVRNGQPVRAEDYLGPREAAAVHPDQLLDLVYAEYLAREEAGEPPRVEELVSRFPHLAERIRRQLELHIVLESEPGSPPQRTAGVPPAAAEPEFIGRYKVVTALGQGGQGTVYRGFDPELSRDVVVKLARRPSAIHSLRDEARVLASLDHPGLARAYDLGTHDGRLFAVLEFVSGRTLDAVAAAEPLAPERAARLVADAAAAVAYANNLGVVHRDLKPQNVMLDSAGRVRVIDFGLARLFSSGDEAPADAGTISGTVAFMAPEQARGDTQSITARSDVFGLGGILYYLLTGAAPYAGGDQLDQLTRAMHGNWGRARLNDPAIPARLRAVCAKALAVDPDERYPTAAAMAEAIRAAVARPRVRAPGLLAGAALVVLLAAVGGVWQANRQSTELPQVPTPEQAKMEPPPAQPVFEARVWDERQGKYRGAVYMLPLATGAKLRYEADATANRHLALFAVEPTGEVRELTKLAPLAEPGKIAYPPNPSENSPLTPPTGTVVLLLCGRADSPVAVEDVRAALGADPWPKLPPRSLLVVEREKLEVRGPRGVGDPTRQDDPEGDVLRRLDVARIKLKSTYDVIAGTAFSFK
jgi:predicted Ser/Thr protein kinase